MEELFLRQIDNYEVYFRKDDVPIKAPNQSAELERIINCLTNEEFESYEGKRFKRRLKYPNRFKVMAKYGNGINPNLTCICGENTCNHLVIVHYILEDIYFAIGSVCIQRFDEENSKDLYNLLQSKKCQDCSQALVFKEGGRFEKNTKKKCFGRCFDCIAKYHLNKEVKYKIYLNCPYAKKDDAKSKGAMWDAEKKQWWVWSSNPNLAYLVENYE